MKNVYDHILIAVGYNEVFKSQANLEEIKKILATYPAAQWLDLLAKIEAILLLEKPDVVDPHGYLANKFFHQEILQKVSQKKDRETTLFSLGQLNVLRKLAILHCGVISTKEEIPMQLTDITRVLLAGQDFHNAYDVRVGLTDDLENFAQYIIRNGYLNVHLNPSNLFVRAHEMFVVLANSIAYTKDKSFAEFFQENVGINIEEAMSLSFALANPFFQTSDTLLGTASKTTILDPKTFFQELTLDASTAEAIVENLTVDFEEVKSELQKEISGKKFDEIPVGYNLDIFKKKPLIRLNNGKLACTNVVSLLEKTTQNLIWIPKSRLKGISKDGMKTLVNDLTSFRGKVFEEYVKFLCRGMANVSSKLKFLYIPPEATDDHEEVGDSVLMQGKRIVILEAKSRQFNEGFKYSGLWEQDKQFIEEFIKKAAKQIETAAKKIQSGTVVGLPKKIRRIYPVILTYEPIPMHAKMQKFIRQKVEEFGLLTDDIFAPLEIIQAGNLEKIMDCANTYTIIELLEKKHGDCADSCETDLHNFLSIFLWTHKITCNGWQKAQFDRVDEMFRKKLIFKGMESS